MSGSIEWEQLQRIVSMEDRILQLELQLSITQTKLEQLMETGITTISIDFSGDASADKVRLFPQVPEVSGEGYASGNLPSEWSENGSSEESASDPGDDWDERSWQ